VYSDRRVYAGRHPCPVGIRWAGCELGHPPGARKAQQAEDERSGSSWQAAHAGCRENMCGSHVNAHFRQASSCAHSAKTTMATKSAEGLKLGYLLAREHATSRTQGLHSNDLSSNCHPEAVR